MNETTAAHRGNGTAGVPGPEPVIGDLRFEYDCTYADVSAALAAAEIVAERINDRLPGGDPEAVEALARFYPHLPAAD